MIRRLRMIPVGVRLRWLEARINPERFDMELSWKIDQVIIGQEAAEK